MQRQTRPVLIVAKWIGVLVERIYTFEMSHLTLPIVVEGDTDRYYVYCPSLQGCYSQGDTCEGAVENIKDAIRLHTKDRLARHEAIPVETYTH